MIIIELLRLCYRSLPQHAASRAASYCSTVYVGFGISGTRNGASARRRGAVPLHARLQNLRSKYYTPLLQPYNVSIDGWRPVVRTEHQQPAAGGGAVHCCSQQKQKQRTTTSSTSGASSSSSSHATTAPLALVVALPDYASKAAGSQNAELIIGVMTGPSNRKRRDAIRQTWMQWPEVGRSVVICFVIGRRQVASATLALLDAEAAHSRSALPADLRRLRLHGEHRKGFAFWGEASRLVHRA